MRSPPDAGPWPFRAGSVGLQAVDLARRARQMLPDRQQEAGHQMKLARAGRRDFSEFLEPERGKLRFGRNLPMAGGKARLRNRIARQRTDQAHALLDAAVLDG